MTNIGQAKIWKVVDEFIWREKTTFSSEYDEAYCQGITWPKELLEKHTL